MNFFVSLFAGGPLFSTRQPGVGGFFKGNSHHERTERWWFLLLLRSISVTLFREEDYE